MNAEALRQQFKTLRAREAAAFEDGRDSVESLYEAAMALAEKCIDLLESGPEHADGHR